jgi:serine/threonine-protein kinase
MPIRELLGDRYRLLKTLRTTPVYHEVEAWDGKLRRHAQMWLLASAMTSEQDVAPRFLRALKAQMDAPAPGTMRFVGGGVVSGTAFLRVAPGRTECLRTRLLTWKPGLDEATAIVRAVARALEAAHDRSFLHGVLTARDVLFVEGHVRVAGVGVWSTLARRPLLAALWHEAHLIAPEVRRGEAPTVAADVYGVAALAAELLQAATGFTTAALRKRGWNPLLIEAVDRLLSGEPGQRPPSLAALDTALAVRAPSVSMLARGTARPESKPPVAAAPSVVPRVERPAPAAAPVSVPAPRPIPAPVRLKPGPPPPWPAPAPTTPPTPPTWPRPRLSDVGEVREDAVTTHWKKGRRAAR